MTKARSLGLAALLVASTALMAFGSAGAATPTPDGWSPPAIVSDREVSGSINSGASVAVDGQGNAAAAWAGTVPALAYDVVFHRMYTPEAGWGPTRVLTNGWGETNQPDVAAASNGNYMIVYRSVAVGVWVDATWYNASAGTWSWSENVNSDGPATDILQPQVAFDGAGNAFAIWIENNGTTIDMKANRFLVGSGWGTPSFLETGAGEVLTAKLAADASGNAVAIWRQWDGASTSLYANRFVVGSGWGTAQLIESRTDTAWNPAIAVDSAGNVEALWMQYNGTAASIFANRFVPGTGWGVAVQVSGDTGGGAGLPRVAAGPGGTFVAAWNQVSGGEYQMMVSRYGSGAWSQPVNLSAGFTVGGGDSGFVGTDASGRAAVVWQQYGGVLPTRLFVSFWNEAAGWTAPARLDTSPGPNSPRLADFAMNGAAQGIAIWTFTDGYLDNLWASLYAVPDTMAPSLEADLYDTSPTHNATVVVDGTTEPGASVTVNGVAVEVSGAGAFSVRVPLAAGLNSVEVLASDAAGNVAQLSLTITYEDPVPGLQSQLAATSSALAAAQTQLTTTQASLATAQSQLAATSAALASTQEQLSTTRANLTSTRSQQAEKNTDLQSKIDAAAGSAGTAMMVGLLGLIVGLAGIAMGFMMSKKKAGPMAPPMPNVPTPAQATAPPTPPPAEPPKAP